MAVGGERMSQEEIRCVHDGRKEKIGWWLAGLAGQVLEDGGMHVSSCFADELCLYSNHR